MTTVEVTGRRVLSQIAQHALAIAFALCFLLPLMISVLTAFMTQRQAGTGSLWPSPWDFGNFGRVFKAMPFGHDLLNTVVYAGLASVGAVASSVPVAYALSRLRWRGREAFFMVVLAAMMLPAQVTSLPLYVFYSHIGWVGTLKPLIVPSFFGDAFSIFLLRQFFLTIPQELTEAARVDGAGVRAKVNFGVGVYSDWTPGSRWEGRSPAKETPIFAGENLVVDPPRRLVQSYVALWSDAAESEGTSRLTWEIEQFEDTCRLTLTHDQLREDAPPELYGGHPMILSGFKTLLETGAMLTTPGSIRFGVKTR